MFDPKSQGLLHVVLTPAAGQGELEVCHIEPVGAERAEELLELFAQVSAGEHASCHEAADVPCPICSATQRDLVAEAVRRACWKM
jgi:hypothetical protein